MSRFDPISSHGKPERSTRKGGDPSSTSTSGDPISRRARVSLLGGGVALALLFTTVSLLLAQNDGSEPKASHPKVAVLAQAADPAPVVSPSIVKSPAIVSRLAPLEAGEAPFSIASPVTKRSAVSANASVAARKSAIQRSSLDAADTEASSLRIALIDARPTSPPAVAVRGALPTSQVSSTLGTPGVSGRPVANASSAVPVVPQAAVALATHPRLILDPTTLSTLRQRASANTPEWKALKATCDSYIGGTVAYPTGTAYPDLPNLGSGYQGSSYLPALLAEGMCYQVLKSSDAAAAQSYGAKAVDILMKMSAPYPGSNGWNPCTDDGYGIRFYGVGYGLGYDWVYELLTPAQRTQIYTTANAWITAWEQPSGCADFEYAHPQSNYFAGYFHAKAVISLATYDENPGAPAQWVDWLGNQFGTRVQPYYQTHLLGGGWPEGYGNYAPLGILNMSLPAWEVKSATGTDLINASAPYSFPLASADYAMHFTWPSRAYFDDRDTNHSSGDVANPPGTTPVGMFEQILGSLIYWNSPKVAVFHQYLNEVSAATKDFSPAEAWQLFLFTDPNASTAALNTLPLSYFAPGMNAVAARSGWDNGASWMSFRAGPYVNNPAQGEEYFDQGSLALVRGSVPLLINTGGWVVHEPNGTQEENNVYADNYGTFNGSVYLGNRQLYNVFYVRNMSGSTVVDRYGQAAYTTEDNQVRTQVSAYEDGGRYVYVLATHLEDMYRKFSAGPGVAAWSREVVYLRPNRFVVFDRTTKGNANYDQFLAWHFPASPAALAAPVGQNRMGITYGNQFVGAMTAVLPSSSQMTTVPLYPGSNPVKAWQVQERPASSNVNQIWLTVFDLSTAASSLASTSPVVVNQGGIAGVQLIASDGSTVVVSSTGAAGTPLTGDIGYGVSPVGSEQVVTDLAPNTGYSASVASNGNTQNITISAGGTLMSSAKGVLTFYVTSAGVVQPYPPAAPPPPYPTVPISSLPVAGFPAPYKP